MFLNKIKRLEEVEIVGDYKKVYSYKRSDDKSIQILIDKSGNLVGKIFHEGRNYDARIKGLPKIISLEQADKLIEFLNLHSSVTLFDDDIIVNPKLKGGNFDPSSLVFAAIGGLIGYYLGRKEEKPSTISISAESGATVRVDHDKHTKTNTSRVKGNNNSTLSIQSELKIDSTTALIGAAGLAVSAIGYGTYYYKSKQSRNHPDEKGNTPLHRAILKKNEKGVRELLNIDSTLSFLKPKSDINAKNKEGNTPLHLAVMNNCPGIVKLLVENGADLEAINDDGKSPRDIPTDSPAIKRFLSIESVLNP